MTAFNMNLILGLSLLFLAQISGYVYACGEVGSPAPSFKSKYSVLAFIDVNTYKTIDCSADHFCQIDWYKDDIPFPFGWDVNQLEEMGVTLDDNNQTLTLRKAEMLAKGNYSCIVSNDQGTISRSLELDVKGNDWIHEPILAFDNQCSDQWVNLGDNVTFSCKVFAGPRGLSTVATWSYVIKTSSEINDEDKEMVYMRELPYTVYEDPAPTMDGKLLTVTLNIFNVTEAALGTYIVTVSNGVEPGLLHRVNLYLQEQGTERRLSTGERRGALWRYMKNNR